MLNRVLTGTEEDGRERRKRERIGLLPTRKEMRPVRWFVLHTHRLAFFCYYPVVCSLHCSKDKIQPSKWTTVFA